MGVVSGSVLKHGGKVTGIMPYAMVIAGGEKEKGDKEHPLGVELHAENGREAVSDLCDPPEYEETDVTFCL